MTDLIRKDATATSGGELSDGTQTIAGDKTFNGNVNIVGSLSGVDLGGGGAGLLNFMENGSIESGLVNWVRIDEFSALALDTSTQLEGAQSLTWTNTTTGGTRGKVTGDLATVDLGYRGLSASASAMFRVVGTGGIYLHYLTKDGVKVDATETTIDATGGGTFYPKAFGFNLDGSVYKYVVEDSTGVSADVCTLDAVVVTTQGNGSGALGGWKQYVNTSSNGLTGDFVYTTTPAGFVNQRTTITPYKDPVSGIWRAAFNIDATCSGVTAPNAIIDSFAGPSGSNQALAFYTGGAASTPRGASIDGSGNIGPVSASNNSIFRISGDIELGSKPTWADFDNSVQVLSKGSAVKNARGRWYRNAAYNMSANVDFAFDTEDSVTYDAAVGITNASGVFTVAAAGTYDITAIIASSNAFIGNTLVQIYVNRGSGLAQERIMERQGSASFALGGNSSVKLAAGDSFSIRFNSSRTGINSTSANTWIEIEQRSDETGQGLVGAGTSEMADDKARYLLPRYQTTTIPAVSGSFTAGTVTFVRIGNVVTVTSLGLNWAGSTANPRAAAGFVPIDYRATSGPLYATQYHDATSAVTTETFTDGRIGFAHRDDAGSVARTNTGIEICMTYIIV